MFPKGIRSVATSMKKEMGQAISRKDFLSSLLQQLEEWYAIYLKEGGDVILNAWREQAQIKGKPVKITSFGETLSGIAVDVDSDGALILRMENGKRRRVVAGDIEYQKKKEV